ncbi:MAG: alpha/beta hydrolase [Bdellovibrionota bacterium]
MKFILVLTALFLVSCSSSPKNPTQKTIVLIHGAHMDGSSWSQVKAILENNGQEVVAPTMPGRDNNKNVDLNTYAQVACDQAPDNSIIVGHSQGGAIANQMVGICPEKIVKIIYVTAVVPLSGERPFDLMEKRDEKAYAKTVVFKKDRAEPKNKRAFLRAMAQDFDHKTTKSPVIYSEPTKVAGTLVKFEAEDFDVIPKAYVFAEADLIITLATQKKYTNRTEFQETYTIVSGHLPMVTKPAALADVLLKSSTL